MRILHFGHLGALIAGAFLLIGALGEVALGQSLAWAKKAGGTNFDQGKAIAVDMAGNSYVTGWFTGSATFGPGEPNETTLTSGGSDVFVAKYSNSGVFLWVKQASGGSETRGEAISVDAAGNSYVIGIFRFSITFDGTVLSQDIPGVGDTFVAKYDNSGNFIWARKAGLDFIPGVVTVGKHGLGISTDDAGNSHVTGMFGTDLGEGAFFVAKYDTNGVKLWAKHAANDGVNPSFAAGAAISQTAGYSYVTGGFEGSITFGPGEVNQTVLTSTGSSRDLFVTKYDSSGTLLWAKRAGGPGVVQGEGISVDNLSIPHLTGSFSGSAVFGPGEINETVLTGVSVQQDIFVAKYQTDGALLWAKQASGPGNDGGNAISVDPAGNSHVTGGFEGFVTFGVGEPNETILINAVPTTIGSSDIFVAKFDPSGALMWAKQASGIKTEVGRGIYVDAVGNSYVTGFFGNGGDPTSVTFGMGEPNETTLTTGVGSGTEIFVAKYMNDNANLLDLDISRFQVTRRARLSRVRPVDITVVIRNNGMVEGAALATVIGVQNNSEVYNVTMLVSDAVGDGATTFNFPNYTPTAVGDILWTVTVADQDPDLDQATAVTTIAP